MEPGREREREKYYVPHHYLQQQGPEMLLCVREVDLMTSLL